MRRALLRFPHLSFIPPLSYPPLRGTFPSRGRLYVGDSGTLANGALVTIFPALFHTASPIQPPPLRGTSFHRKEGVSTRAPFLGRGCRAQRGEIGFLFGRRSRLLFAYPIGEMGPRSDALVYDALETISPLFFIPLVPYPPLRGTFPLRGRLYVGDSDARVYDALETIFSLSFMPPVPYPPLRGTFPMRGRLCSSALVFPRILYSLWRYRITACRASILRKQKPLCEDWLCRAVSGSIILRSRILRDFSAYPHHFLS